MKKVLIASGFDPSGGAGTIRDLSVMWQAGVRPVAVVTAITAQDAERFLGWEAVKPELLRQQLDAVMGPACRWVKIGMVGSVANFQVLMDMIGERCPGAFVVLDPVLESSTGQELAEAGMTDAITERLDRIGALTPNISELQALTNADTSNTDDCISAARVLTAKGIKAVVAKGGHAKGRPTDILVTREGARLFPGARYTGSIHGTGCAFSSAMTAFLARKGMENPVFDDLAAAVAYAKDYVTGLIRKQSK